MAEIPYTVEVIEKLRVNYQLGKHKHFNASTRGRFYHVLLGIPTALIGIFLGSALLYDLQSTLSEGVKWIAAGLALLSALLAGVQTFFDFRKEYEAHRAVGNRYLHLAREAERLIALFFDGQLPLAALSAKIEELNEEYARITTEAEEHSTRDADFEQAKALQATKSRDEPSLVARKLAELRGP